MNISEWTIITSYDSRTQPSISNPIDCLEFFHRFFPYSNITGSEVGARIIAAECWNDLFEISLSSCPVGSKYIKPRMMSENQHLQDHCSGNFDKPTSHPPLFPQWAVLCILLIAHRWISCTILSQKMDHWWSLLHDLPWFISPVFWMVFVMSLWLQKSSGFCIIKSFWVSLVALAYTSLWWSYFW